MKNQIKSIVLVMLTTILFVACDKNDDYNNNNNQMPVTAQFKVIGQGPSVAQPKTVIHPRTGESFEAFCFLMNLVDANTGETIGTLEDCEILTILNSDGTFISEVITTFNLDGRGSFTSESTVFQAPLGSGRFSTDFTPDADNIIDGTFEFEGAQGTTILSGEVDMSLFDQNIVTFNCQFDVNLEIK